MNRPSRSPPTLHVFFFFVAETFSLVDGWINDFQGRREMEKRKIKQAERREAGREKRSLCERFRGWDWKCIKAKEGLAPTQNHLAIFLTARTLNWFQGRKKKKAFTKTPLNTLDKVSKHIWIRVAQETQEHLLCLLHEASWCDSFTSLPRRQKQLCHFIHVS